MSKKAVLAIALLFGSILLLAGFIIYRFGREVSFLGLFLSAVVLGALSRIPDRFSGKSSGIDVGVFLVLCISLAWGFNLAFLVGVLINVSSFFVAKERPQDTLAAIFILAVVLLAGSLLPQMGVFYYGMVLVLFYDLLCTAIYPFLGHTIEGNLRFALVHFVWNYALFSAVGADLVRLLASVA